VSYVTAVRARKIGQEYLTGREGDGHPRHRWQWYALAMSDGTERHTSVPAGPRAAAEARRNVTETRRAPGGAGHYHRPDIPRRAGFTTPCPDDRCA
jgi:hypothetical protein